MGFLPFRNALASLTLIGSLTSFFGASFIALCYIILPMKRHFRHALILNLAIADGLNALGNSISGMYILTGQKDITPSAACTLNGFVGQITVQATDFAILAISIVTLLTITRGSIFDDRQSSRSKEVLICLACWIVPCITSFTVLGMHKYGPVSGNWCWIVAKPTYLRYVMTHGWRFAFIFSEIVMYSYLHFWLRAHFKNMNQFSSNNNKNFTNSGVSGASTSGGHQLTGSYQLGASARRASVTHIAPEDKFNAPLEDKLSTRVTEDEVQRVAYVDGPSGSNSQTGLDRTGSVRVGVHTTLHTDVAHASGEPIPANSQAIRTTISSRADNRAPQYADADDEKYKIPSNPFAHRRLDDEDDDSDEVLKEDVELGHVGGDLNSIPLQATDPSSPGDEPVYETMRVAPAVQPAAARPQQGKGTKHRKFSHGRIQKILLLNAYPAAYILLWIPGLANRIAEASGHPSKVLQIMQASTQFVGFANALTYGWNERISNQLMQYLRKRDPRSRS